MAVKKINNDIKNVDNTFSFRLKLPNYSEEENAKALSTLIKWKNEKKLSQNMNNILEQYFNKLSKNGELEEREKIDIYLKQLIDIFSSAKEAEDIKKIISLIFMYYEKEILENMVPRNLAVNNVGIKADVIENDNHKNKPEQSEVPQPHITEKIIEEQKIPTSNTQTSTIDNTTNGSSTGNNSDNEDFVVPYDPYATQ